MRYFTFVFILIFSLVGVVAQPVKPVLNPPLNIYIGMEESDLLEIISNPFYPPYKVITTYYYTPHSIELNYFGDYTYTFFRGSYKYIVRALMGKVVSSFCVVNELVLSEKSTINPAPMVTDSKIGTNTHTGRK